MALRVFSRNDDNLWIKRHIIRQVKRDMTYVIPNGPWVLDTEQRLTLLRPRMRDRAFFRMTAYPGSGMMTFDLEPAPNTYMLPEVFNEYHAVLLDYLSNRFSDRFYLMERIPFEFRRPNLDIPPHLRPGRFDVFDRL